MTTFNLDQAAKELTDALSKAPPLAGVPLADARKAVEAARLWVDDLLAGPTWPQA